MTQDRPSFEGPPQPWHQPPPQGQHPHPQQPQWAPPPGYGPPPAYPPPPPAPPPASGGRRVFAVGLVVFLVCAVAAVVAGLSLLSGIQKLGEQVPQENVHWFTDTVEVPRIEGLFSGYGVYSLGPSDAACSVAGPGGAPLELTPVTGQDTDEYSVVGFFQTTSEGQYSIACAGGGEYGAIGLSLGGLVVGGITLAVAVPLGILAAIVALGGLVAWLAGRGRR